MGASNEISVTTAKLAEGSHSLTASYSGDSNFRPSVSSSAIVAVTPPTTGGGDFSFIATGTSTQTVVAGGTTNFIFSVQPQSGLASQISLAVSGLPNLATASFNPAYVPPGSNITTVTLSIGTLKSAKLEQRSTPIAFAALFSPLLFLAIPGSRRRRTGILLATLLMSMLPLLSGCGDRIYTGSAATQTSKTYTLTITGTATGNAGVALQHATTVTLTVVPST